MINFCFMGKDIPFLRSLAGGVAVLWVSGLITCGFERIEASYEPESALSQSHDTHGSLEVLGDQIEGSSSCQHGPADHHEHDTGTEDDDACCSTTELLAVDGKMAAKVFIPSYEPLLISSLVLFEEKTFVESDRCRVVCDINRGKILLTPLLYLGPGLRSQAPPFI